MRIKDIILQMSTGQTTPEEPNPNPELVINGDFSQGQTGWNIKSGTWNFGAGVASVTKLANIYDYIESIPITVSPNTAYKFFGDKQSNAVYSVVEMNGGSNVKYNDFTTALAQPVTITTQSTTNNVVIRCAGAYSIAATFTFDNITLKKA